MGELASKPEDAAHYPGMRLVLRVAQQLDLQPLKLGRTRAGFSTTQLLAMFICQLHEAVQVTIVYTIAVFFVRDYLGPASTEAQVGR